MGPQLLQTAKKNPDPIASATGGVTLILGGLGLVSKWGLTADQVAMIVGGVAMVAGAIRTWLRRGAARYVEGVPAPAPAPVAPPAAAEEQE